MKRNNVSILLILISVLVLFTACGKTPAESPAPNTSVVMGEDPKSKANLYYPGQYQELREMVDRGDEKAIEALLTNRSNMVLNTLTIVEDMREMLSWVDERPLPVLKEAKGNYMQLLIYTDSRVITTGIDFGEEGRILFRILPDGKTYRESLKDAEYLGEAETAIGVVQKYKLTDGRLTACFDIGEITIGMSFVNVKGDGLHLLENVTFEKPVK